MIYDPHITSIGGPVMTLHRIVRALILGLVASVLVGVGTPVHAESGMALRLNCPDFPTQRAAQIFFNSHPGDPEGLDTDSDGIACESNPCPCYFGSGDPNPDPTPVPPKPKPVKTKAVVVKVLKGDAVKVQLLPGGPKVGVQLLGAKAPGVASCGGKDSKRTLKKILPRRTVVWLTTDLKQPNRKAGRLFRYVNKVKGGKDAGRALIIKGYAETGRYSPRKFDRRSLYQFNEDGARAALRGNWGTC